MKVEPYLRQIGQNLKEARIRMGLRQIDVHTRIGLTYRHYQNIEAGRINLTVGTLCRLAKLFRSKIADLVSGC